MRAIRETMTLAQAVEWYETLKTTGEGTKGFWDDFILPPGPSRELVIESIEERCALVGLFWDSPTLAKRCSDLWFKKNYLTIQKLWESTLLEYNPIENYDRIEGYHLAHTEDDTVKDNGSRDSSETGKLTGKTENRNTDITDRDLTTKRTETVDHTGTDNTEGSTSSESKVSAYNSDSYVPESKTETTSSTTLTRDMHDKSVTDGKDDEHTIRTNDTDTDVTENTENKATETTVNSSVYDRDHHDRYDGRAHGNIGVTSSQQLIQQERNIVQFNVYDWIADKWEDKNCLCVY